MVIINLNLASYLEEAIRSVLDQGYPNLELVVVDGGSTDGSVEVIERYAEQIKWWVSEKDEGQYDAVEKGFAQTSGEIMAWLNSDDKYLPRGLWEIGKIFQCFPEVEWLQGFPIEYHPDGGAVRRIAVPWARWSKYRYLTMDFQFIMQETTFWRRSLWEKAGGELTREYKLAGDMELWARFFRHAKLYTTLSLVGGFRYRGEEQVSHAWREGYLKECAEIVRREKKRLPLLKRLWWGAARYVMVPFGIAFFLDIPFLRAPYRLAYRIPPLIKYDFDHNEYVMKSRQVRHPSMYLSGRQIRRNPERLNA